MNLFIKGLAKLLDVDVDEGTVYQEQSKSLPTRTKEGALSKEMYDYLDEQQKEKKYLELQDKGDGFVSIKINPDKKFIYHKDDMDRPRCSTPHCRGEYMYISNKRKYCERCMFSREVMRRELARAERLKHYQIAYFVMNGGIFEPFIYDPDVDYFKMIERKRKTNGIIKVVRVDGGIRGIPASNIHTLDIPSDMYGVVDEDLLELEE